MIRHLSRSSGAIADNARHLLAWDYDFQGRQGKWLRSAVRSELIAAAERFLARHEMAGPTFDADAVRRVSNH